ncbi:MAG: HepT-like ribonuclease domain-containing protein [Patescibacteria group bacterium]
MRRLGIIGEAATKLPQNIRLLAPDVPWKSIVGLRNIVIHEYATVSMGKAWDVTQNDPPNRRGLFLTPSCGIMDTL